MGLMGREFGYALCRFRRFQLFGCISWEGIWHLHYIGFRLFIILSRCHSFQNDDQRGSLLVALRVSKTILGLLLGTC